MSWTPCRGTMLALWGVTPAAFVSLSLFACVSERAGYDDVRRITAARVGAEVTWHEEGEAPDAEVAKLLEAPLDAERAVRIALLQNRELQAGFEALGVARGEWVAALRLPNPHVAAGLRYGAEERPEIELEATINLSQLLFLAGRSGVGESALEAATVDVAGQAVDLAFETRAVFFAAQAAEQRFALFGTIVGALQASAEMANELYKAGNITAVAWQGEQAAFQEARITLARAEADAQEKREALNAQLGLTGEAAGKWTLVPELPKPTPIDALVKDAERRAVEQSLDIELTKRRFEAAARRANVSRFEGWFPELHAGIGAERAEGDFAIGPVAEVEVPLFYQGQGETAGALAEMRRQSQLAIATAVKVRARARALVARLQTSEQSVAFYRDTLLPLRQQIVDETQLQYNAMNTGVFQLLAAKRDEVVSRAAEVEALLEYWTLRSELERLLAGRLSHRSGTSGSVAPLAAGRGAADAH